MQNVASYYEQQIFREPENILRQPSSEIFFKKKIQVALVQRRLDKPKLES